MLYVNPMESSVARLGGPGLRAGKDTPEREKAALEEFERVFLFQLLREMRRTVPEDSLFGKSATNDYMQEMLDDHYAGVMAKSGQFGIAQQMATQMHAPKHPTAEKPEFKPLRTP